MGRSRELNIEGKGNGRVYLKAILQALNATPGVKGCLVVDKDGFVLANSMPGAMNVDDTGAIASQVYGVLENFGYELKQGAIDEVLVEGNRGATLLRNVDQGILLVTILSKDGNLGFIRMEVRKATERIKSALYEPTPVDKLSYRAWGETEKKAEIRAEVPSDVKSSEIGRIKDVLQKSTRQLLLRSYLERHANDSDFPAEILHEEHLRSYLERHANDSDFPAEILQEKSMHAPHLEEETGLSRESLLKKYRLKDPDDSFLRDIIATDCRDVLEKIKGDLTGRVPREVVDMEIENQLNALNIDAQNLTCVAVQRLVSNLGDFLIAIAGEEEAKAMMKRFDGYIPHHLATP